MHVIVNRHYFCIEGVMDIPDNISILAIDDELVLLDSLEDYFSDYDVIFHRAENGKQGIELFTEHQPDIILCDLRMPVMSGQEVVEVISKKSPETPIIIISGNGDIEEAITIVNAGAWDYLLKPVKHFSELNVLICRALEKAGYMKHEREYKEELEKRVAERTRELEIEKNKAEVANQIKSEFLQTMSHEFRTPLNGILGMTELLIDGEEDSHRRELLEIILDSCELHLNIVNEVLQATELEFGRQKIKREEFNLPELVKRASSPFYATAEKKHITLTTQIDSRIPTAVVGDKGKLSHILLNLIGNAAKFTDTGGVHISVAPGLNENIIFSVRDTGIGISPENNKLIYEPFFQIDGTTTRFYEGIGLGLTIVKRLSDLLCADLTMKSTIGEGTEFTFTLNLPESLGY